MGLPLVPDDGLRRLRDLGARMDELQREHLRRLSAGEILTAILVICTIAIVGAVGIIWPLDNRDDRWWLLIGVPGYGIAMAGAWLALRRLRMPHGPVRDDVATVVAERDAAAKSAVAERLGANVTVEAMWDAADGVYAAIKADAQQLAPTSERQRTIARSAVRWMPWALVAGVITIVVFIGGVGRPIANQGWSVLIVSVPATVGLAMVTSVLWRRALVDGRLSRAKIAGYNVELEVIKKCLVASGVEAWRFPAPYVQRAWLWTGRGPSPAQKLRSMPANTIVVRKWFWRYLGLGVPMWIAAAVLTIVIATIVNNIRV